MTGASRGIGKSIALALARAGARVALVARTESALKALATEVRADGGTALPLAADVTDDPSVLAAVERTRVEFGGLDIVINNAGVPSYGRLEETTLDEWQRVIDVNLRSMFLVCRAAAQALFLSDAASVVNVGSIGGLRGMRNMTAYCAAKAGVVGLTQALAAEWASRNVRVNCVCPGAVATEMTTAVSDAPETAFHRHLMGHTPQRRFAGSDEIARSVLFLASAASSNTTGAVLPVDGGFTAV